MSRGHGAAQRFVLAELAGKPGAIFNYLAADWSHYKVSRDHPEDGYDDHCDCPSGCEWLTTAEHESIRRAVKSLEREGLVGTWWDDDGYGPYKRVRLATEPASAEPPPPGDPDEGKRIERRQLSLREVDHCDSCARPFAEVGFTGIFYGQTPRRARSSRHRTPPLPAGPPAWPASRRGLPLPRSARPAAPG
jgi:hypothetical protein